MLAQRRANQAIDDLNALSLYYRLVVDTAPANDKKRWDELRNLPAEPRFRGAISGAAGPFSECAA